MQENNLCQQLTDVRRRIADLSEEELRLIKAIHHAVSHESGQRTYQLDGIKVECKAGFNVRLDKALLNATWSPDLPINREYAYTLRATDYRAMMADGPIELRKALTRIVTETPAKPSVKIIS